MERTASGESAAFRPPARTSPVSREEGPVRVRDCFHRALPRGDRERVMEMLASLKSVDDIRELMGGRWGLVQVLESRKQVGTLCF